MQPIAIHRPPSSRRKSRRSFAAWVQIGDKRHSIWYRTSREILNDRVEPLLAIALLPAMKLGTDLQLPAAASPRLLGALDEIQNIFHLWDRRFQKIQVHAPRRLRANRAPGKGVACFFSGGLDSFYTALKHRAEIDSLVFVHGFDISLDKRALRLKVARAIRRAARELGKPLIEIESNLRSFCDPFVPWKLYHGAALASVALLLSDRFRKVYIPSSDTYAELYAWGSHPLLDPLWSTEETQIVHDGCEATRVDKLREIRGSRTALRTLRVCWQNRGDAYNCGKCEKCLHTLVALRIVGALDACTTFNRGLDLRAVERLEIGADNWSAVRENLRAAEATENDPDLVKALRDCLSGRYRRGIGGRALQALDRLGFMDY